MFCLQIVLMDIMDLTVPISATVNTTDHVTETLGHVLIIGVLRGMKDWHAKQVKNHFPRFLY